MKDIFKVAPGNICVKTNAKSLGGGGQCVMYRARTPWHLYCRGCFL